MSELNAYLLAAAVLVAAAYALNAAAYRRRFGTLLRPAANTQGSAASVGLGQIATAVVVVLAGIAFLAAPVVAPASRFALWLQQPFSLFVYVFWCLLAGVMIGSLSAVFRFLACKR